MIVHGIVCGMFWLICGFHNVLACFLGVGVLVVGSCGTRGVVSSQVFVFEGWNGGSWGPRLESPL